MHFAFLGACPALPSSAQLCFKYILDIYALDMAAVLAVAAALLGAAAARPRAAAGGGAPARSCSVSPDSGSSCRDPVQRFYFDVNFNDCKAFDYGGCDGNDNR